MKNSMKISPVFLSMIAIVFSKLLNWELQRESYEKNVWFNDTDSSINLFADSIPSFSIFGMISAYSLRSTSLTACVMLLIIWKLKLFLQKNRLSITHHGVGMYRKELQIRIKGWLNADNYMKMLKPTTKCR